VAGGAREANGTHGWFSSNYALKKTTFAQSSTATMRRWLARPRAILFAVSA